MSELLSFALFLASVLIYAWKAGRNTWWFAATLTVLGLFVVLNITLFASDYFTGDGINDAVLYTLTNSLTGAGVSKYILPGIGIVLGLTAVFGRYAQQIEAISYEGAGLADHAPGVYSLMTVVIIRTILVTACWHSYWRWVQWMPARHFVR